jgi:signal transduction histidine kinase/DNA-binding NarL/FixJ family response regulator
MPSLQILHLEDDAFDADLVHREIERLELSPTWTHVVSVDEFHDAMATRRFDAVISDSRVQGIDGLQAMSELRQRQPNIPFIFVSGNHDPRWAEHCIEAGATDYVPKNQLWRLPSAMKRLQDAREAERMTWLTAARARLVDIVRELSLARSTDAIVEIVRLGARELVRADGATFVLRDGDQCHYVDENAIAPLWKGCKFPLSACISGWAMLNGRAAVIPDIYVDERIPHEAYRPTFVKSLVMVPIRAEAPIGSIGTYWAKPHEATPDEVELLQALADSTSLAFENVALVEGLERSVRERTAELEETNRELEAFTYSVSHDLRAPLRAIQGYGELMSTKIGPTLDDQSRTFLHNIRISADRMNTLIDDMLTLSKVTRAEVKKRAVPIGALVRDIVNHLEAAHPERHVRVDIDLSLMTDADGALLRLALENLLANAWKFTSKREDAHIEFFAERELGRTVFCVRDNGAGFDMAYADQLFEPFRRLHREVDFPGTGVGLAIVHRVLQKHGGEIWVEAAKDQGATFYFTLPESPAEASTTLH